MELGAPKQRAVLAALLLRPGQVVSVDELIDQVWGESPPDAARKAVQVYVSRLRRALPEAPPRGQLPGYVIDVRPDQVDLHRFRAFVAASRGRAGADADELLRRAGDEWAAATPLAGLGDIPLVRVQGPPLLEERLSVTRRLIEAKLDMGRHAEVIGELLTVTGEHPHREDLHGLLMLALHRAGRTREAIDTYEAVRRRTRRELGAEPGSALRELCGRILRTPAPGTGSGRTEAGRTESGRTEADRTEGGRTARLSAGAAGEEVERIDDFVLVGRRLRAVAAEAREILAMHPSPRRVPVEDLDDYLLMLGERDTHWRTIVDRGSLADPAGVHYCARLHRAGDRHRVTDSPAQQLVIIDRAVAFVPTVPRAHRVGAFVIRQPGIVATLVDLYEQTWDRAVDLDRLVDIDEVTAGAGNGRYTHSE
ncbi:AfsR/SARP family transcriptional regulator [Streptomyces paludis]|uniref:AfsR/SARP family transcriptional regulator n=1 Tax=Streptomyces paludis TaxID=2282738 RepID=UPI0013B3E34C|nr:AfsR/SARP family transcriptional regulator [Streptomyces paludis]